MPILTRSVPAESYTRQLPPLYSVRAPPFGATMLN
jgi:hypothetical protein